MPSPVDTPEPRANVAREGFLQEAAKCCWVRLRGLEGPSHIQATYRTVPADHCTPRTESDITSHPTRASPVTSRGEDSCPKIRKKEQVTSRRPHSKVLGFKIENTVWSFPATWKVLQAPAGNDILKVGAEDQGCSFQASPKRQG